jgi:hypothetical protein
VGCDREESQGTGTGVGGGGGGVDGLDRRQEPGRELPDENGGDGSGSDAADSGGEESQGSSTEAAGWFVSRGGATGRKDVGEWGRRIEGKKPKKKKEKTAGEGEPGGTRGAAVGGSGME